MDLPPLRGALARHLAGLRLPERTLALLGAPIAPGAAEALLLASLAAGLERTCRAVFAPRDDPRELGTAVRSLSGLGPGLTPSGDDLLVGVLAAARRLALDPTFPPARLELLRQSVGRLPPDATTPTARQMLAHAVRGAFPEPLPRLAAELGDERFAHAALSARVDRLLTLGDTSGGDLLAGVVGLLRAWLAAPA